MFYIKTNFGSIIFFRKGMLFQKYGVLIILLGVNFIFGSINYFLKGVDYRFYGFL